VGTTSIYVTHDQKEALSMADRLAVMEKGQIIQVGTPEEVYNKPASRFVADFMGEANFIDGVIESGGVATSLGTLAVAPGEHKEKNVTCCVRPENITLLPEHSQDSSANFLTAKITSLMYLGDLRQFHCRLANGEEWKVSTLSVQGYGLKVGQQVKLHIPPEQIALVPR
jgi:putative spermidine/putrescine transport system ATP-binding protein/spermidine/putrescine transport system ATP-binding protein